jgi:hypothetical protein
MNVRVLVVVMVVAALGGWVLVRALSEPSQPAPDTRMAARPQASVSRAPAAAAGNRLGVGADRERATAATRHDLDEDLIALADALDAETRVDLYVFPDPAPGVDVPTTFKFRHLGAFWQDAIKGVKP